MPSLPKDVHVVDLSPHVNEVLTTPEAGESMLRRQIRSDCYLSSLTRSNDRRPSAPLLSNASSKRLLSSTTLAMRTTRMRNTTLDRSRPTATGSFSRSTISITACQCTRPIPPIPPSPSGSSRSCWRRSIDDCDAPRCEPLADCIPFIGGVRCPARHARRRIRPGLGQRSIP
jgi:hypothetical protein